MKRKRQRAPGHIDKPRKPEPESILLARDATPQERHKDLGLLRRAVREGWPVSYEIKKLAMKRLRLILRDEPENEPVIGAIGKLIGIDANNIRIDALIQADEHHADGQRIRHTHEHSIEQPDERRARLSAIARRIGLGGVVDEPTESQGYGRAASNGNGHAGGNGAAVARGLDGGGNGEGPAKDATDTPAAPGNGKPKRNGHAGGNNGVPGPDCGGPT